MNRFNTDFDDLLDGFKEEEGRSNIFDKADASTDEYFHVTTRPELCTQAAAELVSIYRKYGFTPADILASSTAMVIQQAEMFFQQHGENILRDILIHLHRTFSSIEGRRNA